MGEELVVLVRDVDDTTYTGVFDGSGTACRSGVGFPFHDIICMADGTGDGLGQWLDLTFEQGKAAGGRMFGRMPLNSSS